jgi:hypothetical protein
MGNHRELVSAKKRKDKTIAQEIELIKLPFEKADPDKEY